MSSNNDDFRWQKVFNFLLEMGSGNLAFNLPTNELKDNLDYLAGSLNMLTEELSTVIHGINPDNSYLHSLVLSIVIDDNLQILDIGNMTRIKLQYTRSEIIDQQIYYLIHPNLHKKFRKEFEKFEKSGNTISIPFELDIKTSEGFLVKINCQFEMLGKDSLKNPRYLILGTKILTHNEALEKKLRKKAISNFNKRKYPTKTRIKLHKDRLDTVNKLHEFIVARLHTKLPKMKEIASILGVSKSKLKVTFKKQYGMGIYAYHRERRLKKSILLLRKTEKTVETISRECGFTTRTHFSTVFKERFGFRPTDLRNS